MKHRMQLALYWVDKADESVNSATSELDAGSWLRTLLTLMKSQTVYDVCLRQRPSISDSPSMKRLCHIPRLFLSRQDEAFAICACAKDVYYEYYWEGVRQLWKTV